MSNILVLCTGNSCRSQIAEGYLKQLLGDGFSVYSAGVETHGLNPNAVKTMAADGVDISTQTSNHIDEYIDVQFDYILTVCDSAKERCPVFPSTAKVTHHSFPDPAGAQGTTEEIAASFAHTRDLIKDFLQNWVRTF